MKNLSEFIYESLEEVDESVVGALTALKVTWVLVSMSCIETLATIDHTHGLSTKNWFKQVKFNGLVNGTLATIFNIVGDIMDKIDTRRLQSDIDEIKSLPEFQEWCNLPKSKQTFKSLKAMIKASGYKASERAVNILGDYVKKGKTNFPELDLD